MNLLDLPPYFYLLLPVDALCLCVLLGRQRYTGVVTYFDITRIIIVILVAWGYLSGLATSTTDQPTGLGDMVVPAIYSVLIIATAAMAYTKQLRRTLSLVTIIIAGLALISLPIFYAIIGPNLNHSPFAPVQAAINARQDQQTARDFQLLSQDIQSYDTSHKQLPQTMSQAIDQSGSYSSAEDVSARINRYTYKQLPAGNTDAVFQLCATFNAAANDGGSTQGSTEAYIHGKGYQCFTFGRY